MITISEDEIVKRIEELSEQIFNDCIKSDIFMINYLFILDGSFMFASDLAKSLSRRGLKLNIQSVKIKSYEGSEQKKCKVKNFRDLKLIDDITLIIDDILDTGNITIALWSKLRKIQRASQLKFCFLLKKEHNRCMFSEMKMKETYIGFSIPDEFVIGYGLDYDGFYRELPYIRDIGEQNRF